MSISTASLVSRLQKLLLLRNPSVAALPLLLFVVLGDGLCRNVYAGKVPDARVVDSATTQERKEEWGYPPASFKPFQFSGRTFWEKRTASARRVLFIGDSNIEQYSSRVDELIKTKPEKTKSVVFLTGGGCLPILNIVEEIEHPACTGLIEKGVKYAKANDVDSIVIGAQWWGYLSGSASSYHFMEGEKAYPLSSGSPGIEKSYDSFRTVLLDLKASRKKVFVILNMPAGPLVRDGVNTGSIDKKMLLAQYGHIHRRLKSIAVESGAIVIDPLDYFCDVDKCPVVGKDGEPLYRDASHMRPAYTRKHAVFIDDIVQLR